MTSNRLRASALVFVAALMLVGTTGCQKNVRVGQRCNGTGWGTDGTWTMQCKSGRWQRVLTNAQVVRIFVDLAKKPTPPAPSPTTSPTTTPPTSTAPSNTPPGVTLNPTSIATGNAHVCALTTNNQAYCWGINDAGQLGNGSNVAASSPTAVVNPSGVSGWNAISAGAISTCAIATNGQAYCWGADSVGRLGNGPSLTAPQTTPSKVVNPSGITGWKSINALGGHACGIANNDQAYCWGADNAGQLGNSIALTPTDAPSMVINPAGVTGWKQITTGFDHTCAISIQGKGYCWGADTKGQLGAGPTVTGPQPLPVPMATVAGVTGWKSIAINVENGCAISMNDQAYCWGSDQVGQLGNGSALTAHQWSPTAVVNPPGVTGWKRTASGSTHSCGIANNDRAFCWGLDQFGKLGIGSAATVSQPSPFAIDGTRTWATITAGLQSSCGITLSGIAYCWGADGFGQLGNGPGTTDSQVSPSPVDTALIGPRAA